MAHSKTLLLILYFSSTAIYAENIQQLHQCYAELGEAGVYRSQAIGKKGDQVFISQKSVTDHSFLIFNHRNVYRCTYPTEGMLKNFINSCHENSSHQHRYNVNLKAGASTFTGVIEVSKSKPMTIQTSLNWVYQTAIANNKEICNVNCKEELGPESLDIVKKELAEHITGAKRNWYEDREKMAQEGQNRCSDFGPTIKRAASNLLRKEPKTETDCFNVAKTEADRVADSRKAKTVEALKTCGVGELEEIALHEIQRFEGIFHADINATADSDLDAEDGPAHGQKD